jgi:hypothetical protein
MARLTAHLHTLRALDVAVPERTQRVLDITDAVTAAIMAPSAGIDLRGMVTDRTRTREEVVAALREAALRDAVQAGMKLHAADVQRAAAQEGRAGLEDERDRIHTALAEKFAAAWALVVAAASAGIRPGMSADAVLNAGRDTSAAWADLGPAESLLDSVREYVGREAWRYVADLPSGVTLPDVQAMLEQPQQRWLTVAAAGVGLRLNSDAQIKQAQSAEARRTERLVKQQRAEQDAANRKHAQAWATCSGRADP